MAHIDLLELPYFEGISMDDLVAFVDLLEPRRFQKDQIIVREGDGEPPPLFIATSGRVAVLKTTMNSGDRCLAELDSPTLFGEIELFCQLPPVATVRALTEVRAFALTRQIFDRLFAETNPALAHFNFNVARVACHRLAVADEMLATLLGVQDLDKTRRAIFAAGAEDKKWQRITGAFKYSPR
jgi:CRP-like cAMP-binding protein